jgi:hypothetical protein
MARQTIVKLIDDLDGKEASETVTFALDGTTFEIDLSDANAAYLRKVLAPYKESARKVASAGSRVMPVRTARQPARVDKHQNAAIRAWAQARGVTVAPRGRIPQPVVDAFMAQDPAALATFAIRQNGASATLTGNGSAAQSEAPDAEPVTSENEETEEVSSAPAATFSSSSSDAEEGPVKRRPSSRRKSTS